MKRLAMFALLLGLTGVVGCDGKKPEKVKTDAPPAEAAPADQVPPSDAAPADAPAGEKPADAK